MPAEERELFLSDLGLKPHDTGLVKLVHGVYKLLKLQSYFTTGECVDTCSFCFDLQLLAHLTLLIRLVTSLTSVT
jgi:ribosome-binding ATPase YchF (GTP1/OBG family)